MKKYILLASILGCAINSQAGLITHTDYTAGATVTAAAQNTNENTIVNEFNGNIDNTNIKSNSLTGDRLQTADTTLHTSSGTIDIFNASTYTLTGFQGYMLLQSSSVFVTASTCTLSGSLLMPSNIAITITPKRLNSRIEIQVTTVLRTSNGSASYAHASIFRGSTNLASPTYDLCVTGTNSAVEVAASCSMNLIDLPATTSATTYTIQMGGDGSNNTANICLGAVSTGTQRSVITVKEWGY